MRAYAVPISSAVLILFSCLMFYSGLPEKPHNFVFSIIIWVFGIFLFIVSPVISVKEVAFGIKGIYHSKCIKPLYAIQLAHIIWLVIYLFAIFKLWPALMGI